MNFTQKMYIDYFKSKLNDAVKSNNYGEILYWKRQLEKEQEEKPCKTY